MPKATYAPVEHNKQGSVPDYVQGREKTITKKEEEKKEEKNEKKRKTSIPGRNSQQFNERCKKHTQPTIDLQTDDRGSNLVFISGFLWLFFFCLIPTPYADISLVFPDSVHSFEIILFWFFCFKVCDHRSSYPLFQYSSCEYEYERYNFCSHVVVVAVVVILTLTRIIKSVVTGQAPATLELRNTSREKTHKQTKGGTRTYHS